MYSWIQNHRKVATIVSLFVIFFLVIGIYGAAHKKSIPARINEKQDSYPINGWLPVQTPDYKITYIYSQTTQQYYYQITLFAISNNPSEYNSYIAQLKQFKQEALAYIHSKGSDPAKLQIQYSPSVAANL